MRIFWNWYFDFGDWKFEGSDDNVISQIENPVKELTFPGSVQEINRLIKNQKQSHFANAEPEQKEQGSQGKRSPLSSILGTFY